MKRLAAFFALTVALAPALFAAPARITFVRTIRPSHDLRVESAAVVYAIGDTENVTAFVDEFVQYAARSGTLHVENAVDDNKHFSGFNEKTLKVLRRERPADAYIGISLFTCVGANHNGEIGDTDASGNRIRRKVQWLDAVCSAKLDVRKPDGRQLLTFMTHGEGTSPRVPALTADDRAIAYDQATHFAAISAAESIAPRESRESIELDDRAPAFDEAVTMINAERLTDARAIWEAALLRHRNSAPLLFNLGAVCEAIGDFPAAESYYRNAARIAPADPRYRTELNQFRRRKPSS